MMFGSLLFISLYVSFLLLVVYLTFTILFRKEGMIESFRDEDYPLVSILKPVRDPDDDIEANFSSFFELDYPRFEIIFGVDRKTDDIVGVIQHLKKKYPDVKTRIIETGHSETENPKIHKLTMMERISKGSLYWVTDSNVRVNPDTLKRLAGEYIKKDSKIIFSPIRATGARTLGSMLENAYINYFLSGNVISAWYIMKEQIIVGKSMLVEQKSLNRFGGFSYFKDYLAEDYMMGEAYTKSKIPISSNFTWITNYSRTTTVSGFYNRMARWAKLRFNLRRPFYLAEILVNPIMLAFSFFLLGGLEWLPVLVLAYLIKLLLEYINLFYVNAEDGKKFKVLLLYPFVVLCKDLLLFIVYFTPFFSRTVKWRGGEIRIGKKTLIAHNQEMLICEGG